MKKRALSMLLALALCFTVLAGVAPAARPSADRGFEAIDNVLKDARADQLNVIASMSAADIVVDLVEGDPLSDPNIDDFAKKIMPVETFEDTTEVYPYFLLRYLEDGNRDLDPVEHATILSIIADMQQLDKDYNTSAPGTSVRDALNYFSSYSKELTNIVKRSRADGAEEFASLGYYDLELGDYIVDDEVVYYARTQAIAAAGLVAPMIYQITADDIEAIYDLIMNPVDEADQIVADKAKKALALSIGEDVIRELSSGAISAAREYIAGARQDFKAKFFDDPTVIAPIFNADKEKAVHAAQAIARDMVEFVLDTEALTYDGSENAVKKIEQVRAYIEARVGEGNAMDLYDQAIALIELADPDCGYRAVLLDLGMKNTLDIYDKDFDDASGVVVSSVEDGDGVYFNVYHRALKNRLDVSKKIPAGELYVVTDTDDVYVESLGGNLWTVNVKTGVEVPETGINVNLTVYRGDGEPQDADNYADKAFDEGTYRYIKTIPVTVYAEGEKPDPEKRSISLTVAPASQNETAAYANGFTVTATFTGEWSDYVRLIVTKEDGVTRVDDRNVLVADLKNGYKLEVDDTLFPVGKYNVWAGENGEAGVDNATAVFEITPDGTTPDVTQGELTIEPIPGIFKVGGELKPEIKGTAKIAGDKVAISVKNADGDELTALTLNVVDGAYSTELELTDAYVPGTYTVVASDPSAETDTYKPAASVETTFVVDLEAKVVRITKPVDGTQFHRGDKVEIEATVEGFEWLMVHVLEPEKDGSRRPAHQYGYRVVDNKLTATFDIDDVADLGIYTIWVGQNGEPRYAYYDTVDYEVVDDETPAPKLVGEKASGTTVTVANKASVETVLAAFAKKPLVVTLVSDVEGAEPIVLTYTVNSTDFDMTALIDGYVANKSGSQKFTIEYNIPEGYEIAEEPISGYDVVDGKVEVTVNRQSISNGTTSKSRSVILDRSGLKAEYLPGEAVTITGTTTGYNPDDKLTVRVTGPDGTVQTFTITVQEFWDGYDLRVLEPGVYTVDVEGQTFTFVITGLDPTIFTDDHVNYIVGYEDGTVRPEANISREEVTAILYRLLKSEYRDAYYQASTDVFSDVEADRWSMASIATLSRVGILRGYEDGTFRPGRAITRAEFAALVSRLAKVEPAAVTQVAFTDVDGHWAANDIYVVAAEGWFLGDTEGTFRPNDNITRAEAITVINRILSRDKVTTASFEGMEIVEFSDLSADAWYYVNVVEATNAHDPSKDDDGNETWTAVKDETNWAE